ncbi:MAG: Kae1-associated kinase Bud32 [Candidatus Hodarchaeota archaeon]
MHLEILNADELLQKGKLVQKGAEANLYRGTFLERNVIIKERIAKKYRHPVLDRDLRLSRTQREAKVLITARQAGVSVPNLFGLDLTTMSLVMELIPGTILDSIIGNQLDKTNDNILAELGQQIALLHQNDIVHGDLTFFNVIATPKNEVFLIDFGLSEFSATLESRAMDLFTLFHTIKGTHSAILEDCEKAIKEGYKAICGLEKTSEIFLRVWEVGTRGRYIEKSKRKKK